MNDPAAQDFVEKIKTAKSPEEAARLGRSMQRQHPDWVWPFLLLLSLSWVINCDEFSFHQIDMH